MNGVEVLTKLRAAEGLPDIPVIITTSLGDDAAMPGSSLNTLGVQRYLRKPIDLPELVTGVRQVLHDFPPASGAAKSRRLRKGMVLADAVQQTVWINDRLVSTLPHKEFELLERLMASSGPIAKNELLRDLGYAQDQGDALKQTVHRLRQDLGPAEKRRIRTTPDGYELLG